jgi:hypothetical protein
MMVQNKLRKLSQWFRKEFLKWYDGGGENGITSKKIFEVEVFFSSQNIDFPFYLRRHSELFFLFPFSFLFLFIFLCSNSWGLGVLMIFEEKITSSKTSVQVAWHGMAWSWLWLYWRWTHSPEWRYARQYFWVRLANNVGSKSFLNFFFQKLNWTHPLTKINTNKSCYVEKYLALVGMSMSLRNLSIFIQFWSISKSKFSKINTNSDITRPNNLDMLTFEILLASDFVSTKV